MQQISARRRAFTLISKYKAAVALAAVVLLSFLLNFLFIGNNGYGNAYYAAAVRSMSQSWHNFFYVSFDPAGVVSVDKPPLGLWVQVLFVRVFGYHGWAMLLPQALAGAGSTFLMYRLTQRYFGKAAGLFAALVFALSPAVVVASRNNTMDMQLILALLGAAWFFLRSLEGRKWRHLLICAALVGVGFNVKMLQAYLMLPAMALAYLIFAREKVLLRLAKGAACLAVVAVVSFGWAYAVDAADPSQRPYVGSSTDNTVRQLILGHNGAQRLSGGMGGGRGGAGFGSFGQGGGLQPGGQDGRGDGRGQNNQNNQNNRNPPNNPADGNGQTPPQGNGQGQTGGNAPNGGNGFGRGGFGGGRGGAGNDIGTEGPLRLWSADLFGQISWLLALMPFVVLAGLRRGVLRSPKLGVAVFWGIYLATTAAFFSFAGFWHRYYLCMMAPGIAALAGIGITRMGRAWRGREGWRQVLLPASIAATVAVAIFQVNQYPQVRGWLLPVILGGAAVAFAALALGRSQTGAWARPVAMAATLAALLAGPFYWSLTATLYPPQNSTLPYAGPELTSGAIRGQTANQEPFAGATGSTLALEQYLVAHYQPGSFLVVAQRANDVADFIVDTGLPAVAYGGFLGSDNAVSLEQLQQWVAQGKVTYFLLSGQGGGFGGGGDLESYVRQNATAVDSSEYGGSGQLYVFGQ